MRLIYYKLPNYFIWKLENNENKYIEINNLAEYGRIGQGVHSDKLEWVGWSCLFLAALLLMSPKGNHYLN